MGKSLVSRFLRHSVSNRVVMCYTGHNLEVNWEKSRAELAQSFENFDADFQEAYLWPSVR